MALLAKAAVILCLCIWATKGQISTVNFTPDLTSYNLVGKITATTAILQQPRCYFDSSTVCNVTLNNCEVYLVPATDLGVTNFDTDKTSPNILSLSPYPTAFSSNTSKSYYLTNVGLPTDFPCQQPPAIFYFRSGAGGICTTANCNGALPSGSTIRFKYVLYNSIPNAIVMETQWSNKISLYPNPNPNNIDDGIGRRSAGMIVITSVLSVLLALLLLLLIAVFLCGWRCYPKTERLPSLGSMRVKKYDTHNLKTPHVNPSYEDDLKKYTTQEVLSCPASSAPEYTDSVKLKGFKNYDVQTSHYQNS